MTKGKFSLQIPDIIHHKSWGYGELEIIVDKVAEKGVCYRHKDGTASFGTFGKDWLEVYIQLTKRLEQAENY
jgi:hypothetical protein